MIPGANNHPKSVASVMELGGLSPSAGDLWGRVPPRKCLVYKEHIDRDKIALNVVEIRTVQDYIRSKN